MSRKAKYDALLIAAVRLNEAFSACVDNMGEVPGPVLAGHSALWGALQELGAVKSPWVWSNERERQRKIGREQAREETRG